MKNFLLGLLSFILIAVVSCSNSKKENSTANNGFVPVEKDQEVRGELSDMLTPDTSLIIEIMEYYLVPDQEEANKRTETYKNIVQNQGNYTQEDLNYYQDNITHIGKISEEAIKLTKEEKYEELITLLDSELDNFYGHPNSDTYTVFLLHHAMRPLYLLICPTKEEYLEKLINLWEFNRTMIEMVGMMRGEITDNELYERVLKGLDAYYTEIGNEQKKKEIESILESRGFN